MTELEYLASLPMRSLAENISLVKGRLKADQTKDEAELLIVYETDGMFRRVLCRGLKGVDLKMLVQAAERAATASSKS